MTANYLQLPICDVAVDTGAVDGPVEAWRHTLGHGGINPLPLPPSVVKGLQKLQPALIRIFLQEFFNVYPDHDCFDWRLLDPYMEALAQTGAKVVAAITIKPRVLYPTIDHAIWRPKDMAEWQKVIGAMVHRYSVEKPIVTYWEVGNETDIGENGGSPYLIPHPDDYFEFYKMTIQPILEAFPEAKVGGPAACWVTSEPLPGLITRCRETRTPLDFISWHSYNSDPAWHAHGVELAKQLLADWPGKRPEMLYTEWNKFFEIVPGVMNPHHQRLGRNISLEDMAFAPHRAAVVAATLLELMKTEMDWSFYYHIWDQVYYPETFASFFSEHGHQLMLEHWNEVPHRFGLFGVDGEVRPQYFVYRMLQQLGSQKIKAQAQAPNLHMLATRSDRAVTIMCANDDAGAGNGAASGQILQFSFRGLAPGAKRIRVYRIDGDRRWDTETLEMLPVECRETYTRDTFTCQTLLPQDSVVLFRLEEAALPPSLTA